MVYKWYILPIGGLYITYHLLREPGNSIDYKCFLLFSIFSPTWKISAGLKPTTSSLLICWVPSRLTTPSWSLQDWKIPASSSPQATWCIQWPTFGEPSGCFMRLTIKHKTCVNEVPKMTFLWIMSSWQVLVLFFWDGWKHVTRNQRWIVTSN